MLLLDGEAMQLYRARYTLAREKADESHQQAQHVLSDTNLAHTAARQTLEIAQTNHKTTVDLSQTCRDALFAALPERNS
jgi:hypothetical protein